MSIFSEQMLNGGSMSPDRAISKLFYLRDQAHLIHFNTRSYEVHKTLDGVYSALDEWLDKMGELLLGYISPKRFENVDVIRLDPRKTPQALLEEVLVYAKELYDWGEQTDWYELSNFAADLEGDITKSKYLLTLQ